MCYPQILKYEIKVRTGIHSPNEMENSQLHTKLKIILSLPTSFMSG